MNGLPYYKAYPRDFIEGTIGMSMELKGAYRLVLDLIYMQAGELPDDPQYISGLLGCSVRKWKSLREQLISAGKIDAENGIISNSRARLELESTFSLQDKQREKRLGCSKNKDIATSTVKPLFNHTDTDTDTDRKRVTKVTPKSDSLFDEFWQAYPRKIGKGQALKAWRAATKKVDPAVILEGLQIHLPDLSDKPKEYQPHPATWLNGERWADELERDTFWDNFKWEED